MSVDAGIGPLGEVTCVRGEVFAVSDMTGDIRRGGDHGFYVRDTRVVDRLELLIDGQHPQPLVGASTGPASATFHAYVPLPREGPDPVLHVERRRAIDTSVHEEVLLTNRGRRRLQLEVSLHVGADFAYIFDVRHSRSLAPATPLDHEQGIRFRRGDSDDEVVLLTGETRMRHDGGTLVAAIELTPGEQRRICLDLVATDVYGTVRPSLRCEAYERSPGAHELEASPAMNVSVRCSDERFERLVLRSLNDLHALKLADPDQPSDVFCAAGSPWYLTLFGRDSLWTAFMAAPLDLDLAGGTLRALARRQGQRHDADTEEAPGKILHEIRRGSLTHRGDLPPNYYGTVDATPLFVIVAHEAWRWGLPETELADLMPHVEAALGWLSDHADPDHDGFIEYIKDSDRGLDNQGWKDSPDGIQFADGRLAEPPIALAEVQGYAHDAALRGAELLEHFDRPGAQSWRDWAARLRGRFRASFWLEDAHGRYPAVALDGGNVPVDGPASNMGHLLATGLLDADESDLVARQLAHPRLTSGWGLRTLATTSAGFNPLSYHAGSVWPHDTAIAIWGLTTSGHVATASSLLTGLVDAAPEFAYRLPELFGGFSREDVPIPVPYPSACRPQAWAAGGVLLLLRACLGLEPDLPGGRLRIHPLRPFPFRSLEIEGLPVAGRLLSVRVDERQRVDVEVDGETLEVDVVHG